MAIRKPKARTVFCRVTEEEYQRLCRISELCGFASVSDTIRHALCRFMDEIAVDPNSGSDPDLRTLDNKLDCLRVEINHIAELLRPDV
jgi:hypothetical protein